MKILFIHGLFETAMTYEEVCKSLELAGHNTYNWHATGLDNSCYVDGSPTKAYVDEIARLLLVVDFDAVIASGYGATLLLKAMNKVNTKAEILLFNPVYSGIFKLKILSPLIACIPAIQKFLRWLPGRIQTPIIKLLQMPITNDRRYHDTIEQAVLRSNPKVLMRSLSECVWMSLNLRQKKKITLFVSTEDRIMSKRDYYNLYKDFNFNDKYTISLPHNTVLTNLSWFKRTVEIFIENI